MLTTNKQNHCHTPWYHDSTSSDPDAPGVGYVHIFPRNMMLRDNSLESENVVSIGLLVHISGSMASQILNEHGMQPGMKPGTVGHSMLNH